MPLTKPTLSDQSVFELKPKFGIRDVPEELVKLGWIKAVGSLLFEGFRGFSAAAFHAACDRKGPTLVVVQCGNGSVFGGFSMVDWTDDGAYGVDSIKKGFLFLWKSGVVRNPAKYVLQDQSHTTYGFLGYGPQFGRYAFYLEPKGSFKGTGNYAIPDVKVFDGERGRTFEWTKFGVWSVTPP